jgi:protein TonB
MNDTLRSLSALMMALLLTLASFWMMMRMVSAPSVIDAAQSRPAVVEFLRRQRPPETPPAPADPPPQQQLAEPLRLAQPAQPVQPAAAPTPLPALPQIALGGLALPAMNQGFDFGGKPYLGAMLPDAAPLVDHSKLTLGKPLMVLKRVPPLYPRRALRRKQQGWVEVALTIAADGSVTAARVLNSEPARVFDQAALKAVRRWRFQPRVGAGPVSATQKIDFRLEQS